MKYISYFMFFIVYKQKKRRNTEPFSVVLLQGPYLLTLLILHIDVESPETVVVVVDIRPGLHAFSLGHTHGALHDCMKPIQFFC